MNDAERLQLIRDYEGQIALYKLRIEHLEEEARLRDRKYESDRLMWTGWMRNDEEMLAKLRVIGIPVPDIRAIYQIEQDWRENGGTQEMVDWWKERAA